MMQRNKDNIILIGFMGSGKTTVGKILSKEINYAFIDTDIYIENAYEMSIKDIFRINGEKYFRSLEEQAVKDLINSRRTVIATGGGTFINKFNNDTLKTMGLVIYLEASLEKIKNNLVNQYRPIMANSTDEELITLYNMRVKIYEEADFTINTDNLSIKEIVSIIKYIREYYNY